VFGHPGEGGAVGGLAAGVDGVVFWHGSVSLSDVLLSLRCRNSTTVSNTCQAFDQKSLEYAYDEILRLARENDV
jgi:hypothetical protein